MKTALHADGSRVSVADPSAVKALTVAAASTGCGTPCDGKPADEWFHPPGGPTTWWRCSDDAVTVSEAWGPWDPTYQAHVELRYSPRCRTAWSRACCANGYFGAGVTSYFLNGDTRKLTVTPSNAPGTVGISMMVNDINLLAAAWVDWWDAKTGNSMQIDTGKY
jgi:hypothetical protein